MNDNIWSNINFDKNQKRVNEYLGEQNIHLQNATENLLSMQVENVTAYLEMEPLKLVQLYKLYVNSEILGNFRTKILTIMQDNTGPEFPVDIYSDLLNEKFKNVHEEEFLSTLNKILSNSNVQNVIINLFQHSLLEMKKSKG